MKIFNASVIILLSLSLNVIASEISGIPNITLNAPSDTACSGENIEFFATGSGAWYEFLVNSGGVITSQQSSTTDTWSSTILNNEDEVIVRNYTTSATICYASDS